MRDINNVILGGRLTRDAEVINGKFDVIKFSLAVNRSKMNKDGDWGDEVSYIDCSYVVENPSLAEYLRKGSRVVIKGSIRQERWEHEGEKRSRVKVYIDSLWILDKPAKDTLKEDLLELAKDVEKEKGPESFDEGEIPF